MNYSVPNTEGKTEWTARWKHVHRPQEFSTSGRILSSRILIPGSCMLESVLSECILFLFLNPLPKSRRTCPWNEIASKDYSEIHHFGQIYKRKAFSGQGLAHTSHFKLKWMYSAKWTVHYGNVDRPTPPVDAITTLHLLKINEVLDFYL